MLIKKCVETVSTQLISDQERIDIMDEILRIKNETPEEKQKKLIKRIKELKNEQGTQNKDAGETIS
jgi:alcohol dehydrogenase class IV